MDALDALYDVFFSDKNYNPNPGSGNLRVNYFTSSKKLFNCIFFVTFPFYVESIYT